jgi:hypothetical protein
LRVNFFKKKKEKRNKNIALEFGVWMMENIFNKKINFFNYYFFGGVGEVVPFLKQNPRNQKSQQTYNTTCQTKQGVGWND